MADFYIFNNGLMTPNTTSGSDQRALNWSRIFSRHCHKINVFTSKPGSERFKPIGFNTFISGEIYLRNNVGLFLIYVSRAVKSCILQGKIKFSDNSIIYSSSDLLADIVPALYMKLRHKRFQLISGMHLLAPDPLRGYKKQLTGGFALPSLTNIYYFLTQRIVMFFLKRLAFLVLVSNNTDREFLIRKGFLPSGVLVTYGACDNQCIDKAYADKKLYDAVYLGRFHPQKGFSDLLQAWKIVIKSLPHAKLAVIGEDVSAGDIEAFIKKNNLQDNIIFLGYAAGEKKYYYLKSSKLLVFPSYYESFGMVALEAMACGVPVVAYDLPVYKGIYESGMVRVGIGNSQAFAEEIVRLLMDEDLRNKFSVEAKALSGNFSWEKTASEILRRLNI